MIGGTQVLQYLGQNHLDLLLVEILIFLVLNQLTCYGSTPSPNPILSIIKIDTGTKVSRRTFSINFLLSDNEYVRELIR